MKKKNRLTALLVWVFPTFAMAQQPLGEWEDVFPFGDATHPEIVAVHLIHLHTGQVLAINDLSSCTPGNTLLWTPPTVNDPPGDPGDFENIPNCHNYLFCCGHSALADGRILVVGGHINYFTNAPVADLFHPNYLGLGPAWNPPANQMPPPNPAKGRWYPTATTLWDGKVLATSGSYVENNQTFVVTVPELYDPAPAPGTWTQLFSADWGPTPPNPAYPLYPYMFVLPDGNLIHAGTGAARILVVSANWTWSSQYLPDPFWYGTGPPPLPPGHDGSVVMYEPGKIMKCGGQDPGVATTYMVDLNGADPNNPPRWM